MFNSSESFLHFIFANEDSYVLPCLARLPLDEYLRYKLREAGYKNIISGSISGEELTLRGSDSDSEYFLYECANQGFWRPFVQKFEAEPLFRAYKQGSSTAVVMDVLDFEQLYKCCGDELIRRFCQGRKSYAAKNNIFVITALNGSEDSRDALIDPEGPFAAETDSGYLCREVYDIINKNMSPLYEELQNYMGGAVSFLNVFTEKNIADVVRAAVLRNPQHLMSPEKIKEYSRFIYIWYGSDEFRKLFPNLMQRNRRQLFSVLYDELTKSRVWQQIDSGLEKLQQSADREHMGLYEYMGQSYMQGIRRRRISIERSDSISERMRRIELPEDMSELSREKFERIRRFCCTPLNRHRSEKTVSCLSECLDSFTDSLNRGEHEIPEKFIELYSQRCLDSCGVEDMGTIVEFISADLKLRREYMNIERSKLRTCEKMRLRREQYTALKEKVKSAGSPSDVEAVRLYKMKTELELFEKAIRDMDNRLVNLEAAIKQIEGPMMSTVFSTDMLLGIDLDEWKEKLHSGNKALEELINTTDASERLMKQETGINAADMGMVKELIKENVAAMEKARDENSSVADIIMAGIEGEEQSSDRIDLIQQGSEDYLKLIEDMQNEI